MFFEKFSVVQNHVHFCRGTILFLVCLSLHKLILQLKACFVSTE